MKSKTKHRSKNNQRLNIRQVSSYEPDFKKAVVLYAEQKSTSEAKRRYGISESNIRRWRRLKSDILEKAAQVTFPRKSKRTNNTFRDYDAFDLCSSLDSMPLEQRLNRTLPEHEPVLHSQPLSPTKLKVTRQAAKPPHPSPKPPTPEPPNEEVCLRWNSHHSNMQSTFPNLLLREQYVDATLVADGQTLKCHRLILSSCSPYFEEVLSGISPFQHPVLFMKDIPFWILKSLCDFMYAGEVHIYQNKLEELLAVAETLKIKGLAGKLESGNEEAKPAEAPKPSKEEKDRKEEKEKKKPQVETPKLNKSLKTGHSSKRTKEPLKKDNILDPLDLLEPVYEELTKESRSASVPSRFKESKNVPVKKGLPKKIKKRKFSEEREESPPPMFLSRKGTRSRPNVKIPRYYHTHYERVLKSEELPESTIVREPHTDQADPLMQVEEIKAEPLDVDDDVIEIEDNVVSFSDQDMPLQDEEIFGNYAESPLFYLKDNKSESGNAQSTFKKISLLPQPIIMDVHSVADKPPNTLKIVDVAQLKSATDSKSDPLATESVKAADDPLSITDATLEKGAGGITITNVETLADEKAATEVPVLLIPPTDDGSAEISVANVNEVCEPVLLIPQAVDSVTCKPAEVPVLLILPRDESAGITITSVESVNDLNVPPEETADNITVAETGCDNHVQQVESVTAEKATSECLDNEENANELGFHIAKVAREQFTMTSDSNVTDSGTVNNLPDSVESHVKKDSVEAGAISEDSEYLAASLEEMLEK